MIFLVEYVHSNNTFSFCIEADSWNDVEEHIASLKRNSELLGELVEEQDIEGAIRYQ